MAYSLHDDFNYVQEQLASIAIMVGVELETFDSMTLNDLLESCSSVFSTASHDINSPAAAEQYAELRRCQQSIKRFWYMFHVLKWRIENE